MLVHAAREMGVRRLAVGATYPDDMAALFAEFLRSAGAEVVSVTGAGAGAAETAAWGEGELLSLARGADHVGSTDPNETEAVRWIPLPELPGLIAKGEISGAATIIGVQHVLLASRAGQACP